MTPPLLEHDYMGSKSTELRLGLPGSESPERQQLTLELLPPSAKGKRGFSEIKKDGGVSGGDMGPQGKEEVNNKGKNEDKKSASSAAPAAKAQVVGWPPIRSYRKNTMAITPIKNKDEGALYIKVSMDGAPYLRKIDLKTYKNYKDLSGALEKMFSGFTSGHDILNGSEFVLTYEDKDGDWMLVGDVPWEMFTELCRRLRIMKGSDAIGLAPRAEKMKNRN